MSDKRLLSDEELAKMRQQADWRGLFSTTQVKQLLDHIDALSGARP